MHTHEEHLRAIKERWSVVSSELDLYASRLSEKDAQIIAVSTPVRRSLFPLFQLEQRMSPKECALSLAAVVEIWVDEVLKVATRIEQEFGAEGVVVLHEDDPNAAEKRRRFRRIRVITNGASPQPDEM